MYVEGAHVVQCGGEGALGFLVGLFGHFLFDGILLAVAGVLGVGKILEKLPHRCKHDHGA